MHVGIDPAPSKDALVCCGNESFERVPARELVDFVEGLAAAHEDVLIAWDSPLSFDAGNGYSDRPVDKRVRKWIKGQIREGRLATGAVNVLPFAGCPHWAISCAALGLPFAASAGGGRWRLAESANESGHRVIEVHPAVALARWWIAAGRTRPRPPLPKYKGIKKADRAPALATIRDGLNHAFAHLAIPEAAIQDDDHLDAWVAWRMATDFDNGQAAWVGSPSEGGYVLPVGTG